MPRLNSLTEPKLIETKMNETNLGSLLTQLKDVDVEKLGLLLKAATVAGDAEVAPVKTDNVRLDDAVSSSSKSGLSWADEVESETSSVAGVPVASERVRSSVTFGGFGDTKSGGVSELHRKDAGLMSQHVRTHAARGLRSVLLKHGVKMPKRADWHIAMMTHTAATMPDFFIRGKDKLRTFAVLGDAALVSTVAAEAVEVGHGLESVQKVRAVSLTDATMSRVFARSEFAAFVNTAAGIDLAHTKTGATALEAIVGLVAYYRSPADVRTLARVFSLVKF